MKIGFEFHQQLDTTKLFCDCPSRLKEEDPDHTVLRRLRPTVSELGEVDQAAMQEFLKGKSFLYEVYDDVNCLVELDEEPPHKPNTHAIDMCLTLATLLNATPVDEIHFMRKLVIDGSNTSGFQRTAIVAMDGYLETGDGKRIGIPTICLEEEAARKIKTEGNTTVYRLDRLGIPLIELATDPDIETPEEALEVAKKIGETLRRRGKYLKARRGLGTIRQDVNVSIPEGARVEIKGVQDLNSIPEIIKVEAKRQERLIEVKEELEKRGVKGDGIPSGMVDVTGVFKKSTSKIIAKHIKKGGKVFALRLPGFRGLLKDRLGPELAAYARVKAGVGGIFHTDELPAYGITQEEVEAVWDRVGKNDNDAYVLVVEREGKAKRALDAVHGRAITALEGVPEETRMTKPDGTTAYMRPLPGAARMYPETDVPPVVITEERLERIRENLPKSFDEIRDGYTKDDGLNLELADQLIATSVITFEGTQPAWQFYDDVKREVPRAIWPLVATTLTSTIKEIKRDGKETDKIPKEKYKEVLTMVSDGKIAKEAIPEVITKLAENPKTTVEQAIEELGLSGFGEDEVAEMLRKVLKEREAFAREKGMDALKPLMGPVMKEVRGRVDGQVVAKILEKELRRFLEG